MNYLLIGLGSAAGGMARYFVSTRLPIPFPWATFVVNFAGGLLIGYLANRLDTPQRLLWITGFCGGFTTFSTFSLEMVTLLEQQRIGMAVSYAAASVACCVAGAAATYHGGK